VRHSSNRREKIVSVAALFSILSGIAAIRARGIFQKALGRGLNEGFESFLQFGTLRRVFYAAFAAPGWTSSRRT
jgi:hypothetical protein